MALNLILNGQTREFLDLTPPATITDLVAHLGLKGDRIAVERNGQIAERSRWHETALSAGDRIELVHFVGGGCCGATVQNEGIPEA